MLNTNLSEYYLKHMNLLTRMNIFFEHEYLK